MSDPNNHCDTLPLPLNRPDRPRPMQVIGDGRVDENACRPLRLVALPGGNIVEVRQPEVTVGRHRGTDLQIVEADISRRHCRLFHADGQWFAEDLDSLNGTLVNGERIRKVVLHSNDVIRIGGQLFQIEIETPAPLAPVSSIEDHERSRNILRSIATMLLEDADELLERKRRKSA